MCATKERDYYLDNAKFILISLVIMSHLIEPLVGDTALIKVLYSFIYLFHMPSFIMISGFLASKSHSTKLSPLVIPYIVFQLLYCLFNIYVLDDPDAVISFTTPYWILWFLVSLIIWKLITPYFIKLRYPIVISIIIAILIGYENSVGDYLTFSRTISFFPFYLIGYYTNEKHLKKLQSVNFKKLSVVILLVGFSILYSFSTPIDIRWFYNSISYAQLESPQWYAGIYRLIVFLVGLLFSISFIALVPRRQTLFSKMGSRTIQPFLLHGFIIKILVLYHVYPSLDLLPTQLLLIPVGMLLTCILSLHFVEVLISPIIKPKLAFLYETKISIR